MKNRLFLIACLSVAFTTTSCKILKKDDAATTVTDTGTGGGAGVTTTSMAGSARTACRTSGAPAGKSYTYNYYLQANGNYNFSMTVVDSATCASGAAELIKYTQFGTWSIEGAATSPAGAYKVKFTVGSASFATPDATFRTYFNSTVNCGTPSLDLSGSSSSVQPTSGRMCNSYTAFPTYTTSYYNVVVFAGTTFQMDAGSHLWNSGTAGSYPASVNTTYTYY